MTETPTLEQIIDVLDNDKEYAVFLIGEGSYEGSFRVDRTIGSHLRHDHYLFDVFQSAEIYPTRAEADEEQHTAAEEAILHRIEHAVKESYYRQDPESGMKNKSFRVARVSDDGHYLRGEVGGENLSRDLKQLIRTSRTLTVMEVGSPADRLFSETLQSSGRVRLHNGEVHLSEMSDEEKVRYKLGDEYKSDPLDSVDNVVEHHPE
jgi:hypothetical protein